MKLYTNLIILISLLLSSFILDNSLYSYAHLTRNGSTVAGNWNGNYLTDVYTGSTTCRACHSSGSGTNLEINDVPMSVNGNDEVELTVSLASGYNPPYHPSAGNVMGMYLMGYDENNAPVSIEDAGWIIVEDPNSNVDQKFNYNEKAGVAGLTFTWVLRASDIPGDYKIKAYSFVGNNDKATSSDYTISVLPTSINSEKKALINSFNLTSYPNPFNPASIISFDIADKLDNSNDRCHVVLDIYDNTGRRVSTLINGQLRSGNHKIKFDGSMFESGVYFVKLSIDEKIIVSNRMLLLK